MTVTPPKTERQSNFEALRIVCALLIVFVHANFWTLGNPSWDDLSSNTAPTLLRMLLQFICSPATYAFVLISGYFGIRVKLKSVLNLLFLLIFWKTVMIIRKGIFEGWEFSIIHKLNPFVGWFIPAYVVMLCFVPALNSFADNMDRKDLGRHLAVLLPAVMILDCSQFIKEFNCGYSAVALMTAYLLGKYLGKPSATVNKEHLRFWYTAKGAAMAFFVLIGLRIAAHCAILYIAKDNSKLSDFLTRAIGMYTSPLVLAGSVLLFLTFKRLRFQSRLINWIALSAFPIIGYHLYHGYRNAVLQIYTQHSGITCVGAIALLGIVTALTIVVIDQIRIFLWRKVISRFCDLLSRFPAIVSSR